MKKIKAVMHRKIEGKVKSITLSMDPAATTGLPVLYEDASPKPYLRHAFARPRR